MPIIRIRDIKPGVTNTYTTEACDSRYLVNDGDMLIGMDGEFNLTKWQSGMALLNQRVCRIRSNSTQLLDDYLRYFLPVALKYIEARTACVTVKHLSSKVLNAVEIPLKPLEEQRAIVLRLDNIQRQIDIARSQLSQLDQLVKSRFVEMFGNCQNRVRLSEVCGTFNGDRGKNYPSGNDRTDEGVPFVNAGHLKNGRVLFDEMDYITEDRYELLSGGKIQRGDLLYCLRGSLGKCAIADFDKGTIASSMMIIRPDRTKILSLYLFQVLTSPDIDRQLKLFENGSSQPNLSAKSVASYLIPLPNLRDQQEFADFVAQIDKSRFSRHS